MSNLGGLPVFRDPTNGDLLVMDPEALKLMRQALRLAPPMTLSVIPAPAGISPLPASQRGRDSRRSLE